MITNTKKILTLGLSLGLLAMIAQPIRLEPRQPDQIVQNGLRLNGLRLNGLRLNGLRLNGLRLNSPASNQQAVNLSEETPPDWLNPSITTVQLPGHNNVDSILLEDGKLSFRSAE